MPKNDKCTKPKTQLRIKLTFKKRINIEKDGNKMKCISAKYIVPALILSRNYVLRN